MSPWLAALIGLVAGLLIARRVGTSPTAGSRPSPGQLLRWLDAAPCGWLILDPADRIRRINPRGERQLHLPTGSVAAGEPLAQVCQAPGLPEIVQEARRRGRPERLEWRLGGEEFELFALPGEQGWMALVLLDRRSLEAQLRQQSRWVSDVAHELRTPLTALLLVGDALADQATPPQAVLVGRLQRELRRLQQLVGDLLDLSRLENTLPAEGDPGSGVPLAPLVEQVWTDGLRPLAEERGIRLELRRDPGRPPVRVRADGARLHRGLLNLLDNALRFSPDGGVVEVSLEPGSRWCRLVVRDHGPGLSEEDLAHMFERFYRGDPSRSRGGRGGSGLGLPIVQQIAVTLGGRVQAGNHPEGGARIEWLLPLAG